MTLKDLPSKKIIKAFYNNRFHIAFKVRTIDIEKEAIYLTCQMKKNNNYLNPSYYITIESVSFATGLMLLRIDKKHFNHLVKNIHELKEYYI